jgi:hypothetical protein
MATTDPIQYDRAELRAITRSFKAMSDEALGQAKTVSGALASFLQAKVIDKAAGLQSAPVASRIAQGSRVAKSSKIGELSFGFVSQKFSGGGTTQQLWGGSEFGSNNFKQFPVWSGREGRGSKGWFIYPTLRENQPALVRQWEEAFSKIVKEFD